MQDNKPLKNQTMNDNDSSQQNNSIENNLSKEQQNQTKARRGLEEKTHATITAKGSALKKYQNIIVGSDSLFYAFYYEFCVWLGVIPGAIGLMLRKIFWPSLFASCGNGVMFAKGIILRHPKKIKIGNDVIIAENVILDARHDKKEVCLSLDDEVILSNDVFFNCKNAKIFIGKHTGIGPQTIIQALGDCDIHIGDDVIVGPHCYIVGGGSYNMDSISDPIWKQGNKFDGGSTVENNVWLGAKVTILGGVTVKEGSVIAANAVVNKSTESGDIIAGVPGKVVKNRYKQE